MMDIHDFSEIEKWAVAHTWQAIRPFNAFSAPGGFTIFTEGKGCRITDSKGKTYLDYWAGIMLNAVGYGRKEIAEAAYNQMVRLHFTPTHEPNIPKVMLSKKLADITPGSLHRVLFGSGGTESIETALKMAWHYQKLSGFDKRYKLIGGNTYHGSTLGAMSTGGRPPMFTWENYPPLLPVMKHVPHPDCSACQFNLEYPGCGIRCAKHVEEVIEREGPETIAAFIDVPIPSSGFIPPREYWPTVRSICDRYGILLILDCVQSGFGRFGKMFACEHYDIVPDIMVVAKALASGYVPISAAIAKKEVAERFEGGMEGVLRHSYTYEGGAATCAAALANLEIIESENLVENSRVLGQYLYDQLQSLYKYDLVGEVRGGLGLNCEVELMKDRKTRKRFSPEENGKIKGMLKRELMEAGLFGMFQNPIGIVPPLVIKKEEIDEIVMGLDSVIDRISKKL